MSDEPEVRVFDSITAAVENSAQPAPPPYSEIQNPQLPVSGPEGEGEVPPPRKGPARKPAAKAGGVTAHAGAARTQVKAKDPE
jgi:hypothetical protein